MKTSFLFIFAILLPAILAAQLRDDEPNRPPRGNRIARYVSRPIQTEGSGSGHLKAAAAAATVPTWQASDGAYAYRMIGANPMISGAGTTTIAANVIPLILTFSDGTTFDPSVASVCSAQSPQSLLLSSPLFNSFSYSANGVSVGNTQYPDFYQRANFWQYAGTSGISPNYHTLLSASPVTAIKIAVPAARGSTVSAQCGRLGEMDINWFDTYLQSTVFTQLASLGVTPASLPVFILSNVVMYQNTTATCCILGYHSAFNSANFSGAMQTYAVGDFETSGDFGVTKDIAALSHEIGEWMTDPTGGNPTPEWGNIGQVSGCQTNLEVGDPLSGTVLTVTMSNSYAYHVQELAFKSWFYRDTPSSGVNGWYSSNGTFKTPAASCEASTTTLTVSPTSIAAGSAATVKIAVAPGTGLAGTPSGSVALVASNSSTPLVTYTLSTGAVNTTAILPAGNYTISAKYAGDLNFAASSSAAIAVTVGSSSVTLSPISLTFASQNVGLASASQTVTLSNKGTAPLSIASISLSGASPGDFGQTNACPTSLPVNASCSVSVTFKPTATGSRTASLSLADNATGSPQTVPLSGTGAAAGAPKVTVSPALLSFAGTSVGTATASQSLSVTNSGTAALAIASVSMAGTNPGDFTGTTNCGSSLAVAASCTVTVTFKPTAAGTRTAMIAIADNATASPQTAALSGTGVVATAPKAVLSASSISFAGTTVGAASAASKVTLTNSGTAVLSFTSVSVTGTNPGDFSQTNTCGSSLAVNAVCTITVTFRPVAKGTRTGTVTVSDNVAGSPQTISLSGTGK